MTDELYAALLYLRQELESDIALATTRDQHIRACQRLASVDQMIASYSSANDAD